MQYSYKRDARTSLFRPYQYLLTFILPFSQRQNSPDVVTLKAGDWVSPNHNIFPRDCTSRTRGQAKPQGRAIQHVVASIAAYPLVNLEPCDSMPLPVTGACGPCW